MFPSHDREKCGVVGNGHITIENYLNAKDELAGAYRKLLTNEATANELLEKYKK